MNQLIQKIFSWFLFLTGLAIIFSCLYSSYNIFNGKNSVPEIFKFEEKETSTSNLIKGKTPTTPDEPQKEMKKLIEEQLKEILPAKTLISFLNLIAWAIFCGILIFAGSQISILGIKLMKK